MFENIFYLISQRNFIKNSVPLKIQPFDFAYADTASLVTDASILKNTRSYKNTNTNILVFKIKADKWDSYPPKALFVAELYAHTQFS